MLELSKGSSYTESWKQLLLATYSANACVRGMCSRELLLFLIIIAGVYDLHCIIVLKYFAGLTSADSLLSKINKNWTPLKYPAMLKAGTRTLKFSLKYFRSRWRPQKSILRKFGCTINANAVRGHSYNFFYFIQKFFHTKISRSTGICTVYVYMYLGRLVSKVSSQGVILLTGRVMFYSEGVSSSIKYTNF